MSGETGVIRKLAAGTIVAFVLVAVWGVLLVDVVMMVPTLEFPQFAAAFALGDLRAEFLTSAVVATAAALLMARTSRSTRLRKFSLTTAAIGAIVASTSAWKHFSAYAVNDVRFPGAPSAAGDTAMLAARLYTPRSAVKRAGIVLVPGSAEVPGSRYHDFAQRFARAGFVVLVPDKRGVGKSGGELQPIDIDSIRSRITLDTLAADAASAVRYLKTVASVDAGRVGYFGVSQAGWVIPIAEQEETGASFAVIMSGPVTSFREEDLFSQLTEESRDHFGWKPPPVSFDSINARIERESPGGFDTQVMLHNVRIPILWIYGKWDNSVPASKSVRNIERLKAEGLPFTVREYESGNHGLFIMRGPAKRVLPYYPDGLWNNVFTWIDSARDKQTDPHSMP